MPNVNDFYPSNYLKASDLKGSQPIVTIDRVEYEPVGREKQMKPIVYFVGKDKGLVLNKTNCNKIVELAGSPITEEWPGVQICLFSTHVEFQGDTVEAIRVKQPVRGVKRAAPQPPPPPDDAMSDDEIPF